MSQIFQFLFGYPALAYAEGQWSLLSGWPRWLLVFLILAVGAGLVWQIRRRGMPAARGRGLVVFALQVSMAALLLILLWRPALVVTTAAPRQNIAAVLLDDSASMTLEPAARLERVKQVFAGSSDLLRKLNQRFQVRLYRFSDQVERIPGGEALKGEGRGSHLEAALHHVLTETEGLPLGAVVLVSDGADNTSASERETSGLAQLKSRRIPLHTVGVGSTAFSSDLQVNDVSVAGQVAAGGIVSASVGIRQEGFAGKTVNLEVRENGALIQSVPVAFERPAQTLAVRVNFTPRSKGMKQYTFSLPKTGDETVAQNNSQSRVIVVDDRKVKLLYLEGEPRWEYKFLLRAVREDPAIEVHTLLRTSANKFYRQGAESEKVLEAGFPKQEELFGYQGMILGNVEAGFFSTEEAQNIYEFVSRRGGGLMLLAGRTALADGGYQNSVLADLLPVNLAVPPGPTFIRREVRAELTAYGMDHPMLQLGADSRKSLERWKTLPLLGDYQRTGEPKPGAVVLARAQVQGEKSSVPLLVTQRFGRGRTMVLATGSSWRWQMEMDHQDNTHELLWRQALRWLVEETAGKVRIATDRPLYRDDRSVELRAEVRDEKYMPVEDALVTAAITAPDGSRHEVPLSWSPRAEGVYTGVYEASGEGAFAVEAVARKTAAENGAEAGRSSTHFQRNEGTLEYYDAQQNRALLARLAEETGGRYYSLDQAALLPDEIVYSKGGITERNVHELWRLPVVFLALLALKGTEWGLRKWWGCL